jgi:DNA-binding transcriptional regulator LsrR (DeoR family)
MYYQQDLSQAEIASRLGTTRSNVSRILGAARDEGVVQIRIVETVERNTDLESEMREVLGIRDARVLAPTSSQNPAENLGRIGADWFLDTVRPGHHVAVSWGSTLQALVDAVPATGIGDVEFVQLVGGLSSLSTKVSGQELVRELASKLHCRYRYLHAPALFESPDALQAMLHESSIANALDVARRCDIAIVGIGAVGQESSAEIIEALHLSRAERQEFMRSAPVGDNCARYFDRTGREVDSPVHDRVLAIELDDLRRVPTVAAVALGAAKGRSMAAAVRGGLLDVIICDEAAARAALSDVAADQAALV